MRMNMERLVTQMQVDAYDGDLLADEERSMKDTLVGRAERLGFQIEEEPTVTREERQVEGWEDLATYTLYRLRGTITAKTRHLVRNMNEVVPEDA